MEESRLSLFSGLIGSAAKSIQRLKAAQMKQYQLSAAHTAFLCRLEEAGGEGLTQGQLIVLEGMDRAQVSRVLKDLCARQLTAPSQPGSGYKRRYVLTPAGVAITREIQGIILDINRFVSGHIPQADIDIFYRTLRTITQNLEQAEKGFCAQSRPSSRPLEADTI